jgi:uncharacterized membrane protein YbhN (UPF0104 family)
VPEGKNKIVTHNIRFIQVFIFLVTAIGLYVLIPNIKLFHSSLTIFFKAQPDKLIIGSAFVVLTFFFSAATYSCLAGKKFNFYRGLLIEFSGMFINRLLPAGIGGIGINYVYLRKRKYSTSRAAAIIAINNIIGLLGHLLLFSVAILFFRSDLPKLKIRYSHNELTLYAIAVLAMVMCAIFLYKRYHNAMLLAFRSFFELLKAYRHRPIQFGGAFLNSLCLTICNIAALYFCSRAIGLHLSFVVLFLVFTLGILLGTASPTPGGLGATEAGLVVGLVAFNVRANDALALALIYRLISFWLPFLLGGVVFFIIKRLNYV